MKKKEMLRRRSFERFSAALKLYAGEDAGTSDVRDALVESMYMKPYDDVIDILDPAEMAAILSSSVRVNRSLNAFIEGLPPGSFLQEQLEVMVETETLPLIVPNDHPAAWFLNRLIWSGPLGCETYKQIAWLLATARKDKNLRRFLRRSN